MDTYEDVRAWLYKQLPMYQRQGASAYKPGLEKMQAFMAYLGNPHQAFSSVHVAGTNGKGSTAHMITSVLMEAGYTVGLYTSPHLKDFSERTIKANWLKLLLHTYMLLICGVEKHPWVSIVLALLKWCISLMGYN